MKGKITALQSYGTRKSKLSSNAAEGPRSLQKGRKTTTSRPQGCQDVPVQRTSGAWLQQEEHGIATSWSWEAPGASPMPSKRQRSLQEGCPSVRTWSWKSCGGPVVQINGRRVQEQRHGIAMQWSCGVPRCRSCADQDFKTGRAGRCKIMRPGP